ncbi:hypothetical protein VNO77_19323 [Canavalia gladiata]|uniref:Uncharacterized protein n=1 Tax=Canavalia gladiata TaxID=3824 RepID=A0AAN9LN51_CANGL
MIRGKLVLLGLWDKTGLCGNDQGQIGLHGLKYGLTYGAKALRRSRPLTASLVSFIANSFSRYKPLVFGARYSFFAKTMELLVVFHEQGWVSGVFKLRATRTGFWVPSHITNHGRNVINSKFISSILDVASRSLNMSLGQMRFFFFPREEDGLKETNSPPPELASGDF